MADKLEQVAIRMVEQPPLYSNEPMNNPDVAIRVMNEFLSQMDRELFCIVNLQADLTPINMNIVSVGSLNEALINPREIFKSAILSNAHSKCEKETIILTNEDDGFYDVYTFNQSLLKRLRSFAEKYPDDCWLKGSSEDGSETYMIKKGRLSLNLRPPYSKDRIHKATERIIEEQKEQSKDS